MSSKKFYESKTFWFNLLALVVLVANGFGFVDFQADPEIANYAMAVVTIINVVLRFATNKSVSL